MPSFQNILIIIGFILFLYSYLRFITDESGNVDLNNYRVTGGILIVMSGMLLGTIDIFKCNPSRNRFLALMMYVSFLMVFLGLKL